jgi:hypothetical protein
MPSGVLTIPTRSSSAPTPRQTECTVVMGEWIASPSAIAVTRAPALPTPNSATAAPTNRQNRTTAGGAGSRAMVRACTAAQAWSSVMPAHDTTPSARSGTTSVPYTIATTVPAAAIAARPRSRDHAGGRGNADVFMIAFVAGPDGDPFGVAGTVLRGWRPGAP